MKNKKFQKCSFYDLIWGDRFLFSWKRLVRSTLVNTFLKYIFYFGYFVQKENALNTGSGNYIEL